MSALLQRMVWLCVTATLIGGLLWLDQHRGGPASALSRCNYLLSESSAPAADVLIVGSSRTGVALDPLAIQTMLSFGVDGPEPRIERIAVGHNPLRLNHFLLENYLQNRGAPKALVMELTFMTQRSVDRLAQRGLSVAPEHYIFRRDINLLHFAQILELPAIAMPFTEQEGIFNLWRFRLRGMALRAGALLYQFMRDPLGTWRLGDCERGDWTREPEWPTDFAFSYGDFEPAAAPAEVATELEALMADNAAERLLKQWQKTTRTRERYPYDLQEDYRAGEVAVLESMLAMAAEHDLPVALIPLPLYGYGINTAELQAFTVTAPGRVELFDVYGQVQADLDRFWYDDGHIELYPAGALTSARLAQHLLDKGVRTRTATEVTHD